MLSPVDQTQRTLGTIKVKANMRVCTLAAVSTAASIHAIQCNDQRTMLVVIKALQSLAFRDEDTQEQHKAGSTQISIHQQNHMEH